MSRYNVLGWFPREKSFVEEKEMHFMFLAATTKAAQKKKWDTAIHRNITPTEKQNKEEVREGEE